MHDQHSAGVKARGEHAMGFPADETTHHFRLYKDGGAIEVLANDPKDTQSIQVVRSHLAHIAKSFARGDFALPMFIHDQVPPGVPELKAAADRVFYLYEATPVGGQVKIKTADRKALKAVHGFLRFQIRDHHTGDPEAVADTRPNQ